MLCVILFFFFFFFMQKTAYEIRKGDWSSDVCSSDLRRRDVPAQVAVAQIERLEPLGPIARRHGQALGAVVALIVFGGTLEGPVLAHAPRQRGEPVRCVVSAWRVGRSERDPLVPEIVALTERGAQHFLPVRSQKHAGRNCCSELARVVDAVAAGKQVFGKDLGVVEVRDRGVEQRNLVLVAKRDIDVVEARFERLYDRLPERVALSFVDKPAVDAENGKRAADRIRERRDGRDGRTRWIS